METIKVKRLRARHELSESERSSRVSFLENHAEELKKEMAHGSISIQVESGKIIPLFTYTDYLDCLAQLRGGATVIQL